MQLIETETRHWNLSTHVIGTYPDDGAPMYEHCIRSYNTNTCWAYICCREQTPPAAFTSQLKIFGWKDTA